MRGPQPGALKEWEILKIIDGWSDSEDEFGREHDLDDLCNDMEVSRIFENEILTEVDIIEPTNEVHSTGNISNDNDDTHTLTEIVEQASEVFNIEDMDVIFDFSDENTVAVATDENTIEVATDESTIEVPTNENITEVAADNDSSRLASEQLKTVKQKYSKLLWKKVNSNFQHVDYEFKGSSSLPESIMQLSTPYAFFNFLFDKNILSNIIQETNLYACQSSPEQNFNVDIFDIQKYIGICILTSIIQAPSLRRYWNSLLGNDFIQKTMSVNRFEKIRQYLHFNNNANMRSRDNPLHDRLYKIRPLFNSLIENFLKVPFETSLCVDEQMCSTKARHYLKQYIPSKPHKWGFKLFVLCGVSGFAYNMEIYTGQENDDKTRLPTEINLGASSNTVIRLTRNVPHGMNFKIFFDNYYTSIPLLAGLFDKGIQSLGTVRKNRIPNCKVPDDKFWKKEPRGKSYELTTTTSGMDLALVSWKDTKVVNLLSNFVGERPIEPINRRERNSCSKQLDCPAIVREYNKFMGGVDTLDASLGRYKIKLRSKKWYIRIFYHLLDVTICNAWLLYRFEAVIKTIY